MSEGEGHKAQQNKLKQSHTLYSLIIPEITFGENTEESYYWEQLQELVNKTPPLGVGFTHTVGGRQLHQRHHSVRTVRLH